MVKLEDVAESWQALDTSIPRVHQHNIIYDLSFAFWQSYRVIANYLMSFWWNFWARNDSMVVDAGECNTPLLKESALSVSTDTDCKPSSPFPSYFNM
jgi:hypothetical protein